MDDLVFDFEKFARLFPLSACEARERCGRIISSPCSLVMIELIRACANATQLGEATPCDVFVFGLGEPPDPRVTKIGGIPFRPAAQAWPIGPNGVPMTFLGQFNFVASRAFFDDLPGDILLVFSADDDICSDDPQEKLRFEWYPRDLLEPLCAAEHVAKTDWTFERCYGVRHRTCDFAASTAQRALWETLDANALDSVGMESATTGLDRLWGMKIGGLPLSGRAFCMTDGPWNGTFLGSISSVWPTYEVPYPWINVPEPLPFSFHVRRAHLEIRVGFVLEFYLQPNGSINWWIQFN